MHGVAGKAGNGHGIFFKETTTSLCQEFLTLLSLMLAVWCLLLPC